MAEPTYRVTFERDEGQEYGVGARVTVRAMDSLFRTLDLDPANGDYLVARCERICAVGWKALRVSLQMVSQSGPDVPLAAMVADAQR